MTTITIDRTNLITFYRASGFLDAEQMLKLLWDNDDAAQVFGSRVSQHGRLFDLSEAKVAPPSAISALCDEIITPKRVALRTNRAAYFGASPLLKGQIKQICAQRPTMKMFDDRSTAYAWATGGR